MQRISSKVLLASLLLVAVVSMMRVALAIPLGSNLSHEAGIWTALAMDLHDGVLYRPILGDDGYGGTRYGPLHVLLQAAGIRAGLSPLAAGLELTLASAALLFWGAHRLLRAHLVDRPLIWIALGLLLAGVSINNALLTIRGDLLPAALNVVGLALVAQDLRHRNIPLSIVAGVLFGLAIFAKVTGIAGVATAIVVLALHRQYRDAINVAAVTLLVAAAGYVTIAIASDGRFVDNVRSCAVVGAGLSDALEGPGRLWLVLRTQDPVLLGLLVVCAIVAYRLPRDAWRELPTVGLIVTFLATVAIFLTPGTTGNHLVDLDVIAVVFLVVQLQRGRVHPVGARVAFVLTCLGAVVVNGQRLLVERYDHLAQIRTFTDGMRLPLDGPIFSDNAVVSIVLGQRPFLLDDYMFRVVSNQRPEMRQDLYARLDRRQFPLIVMRYDPLGDGRADVFGEAFREHLTRNYDFVDKRFGHFIYRPKKQGYAITDVRVQ